MAFTKIIFTSLSVLSIFGFATADMKYQACPLLRAYYPPPSIQEPHFRSALNKMVYDSFTSLVSTGNSKYGAITPNTTSFSVVFFSGNAQDESDPILFEYHHGASNQAVTADTTFLTGDLTQILTVYHWLVEVGEQHWETSITEYLPELKKQANHDGVAWDEVTLGALAGQMSGLARTTGACKLGHKCDWKDFSSAIQKQSPVFQPDTTPILSHSAFQLISFAIERQKKCQYADCLRDSVLSPLKMHGSGLLTSHDRLFDSADVTNVRGDPSALSLVTTTSDLARFGNAILASKQLGRDTTRRWISSNHDTSNVRNGVGRPWQIYRAASSSSPVAPIIDIFNLNGVVGPFASYFGLVPDVNVGFAILAHDNHVPDEGLDLNVYADIVSDALPLLLKTAATQTAMTFMGSYSAKDKASASVSLADDGPGLVVSALHDAKGRDLIAKYADKLHIDRKSIDFKLYPTNVGSSTQSQWVMVFQDKSDPADEGTPTCITWQTVGASRVPWQVVFKLTNGKVTEMSIPDEDLSLYPAHN